jgi:site-specific DNA-methyltransferase (adenine-specific)
MPTTQTFKAIYFSDYKEANPKSKGLILAFGEKNKDLYKNLASLESNEIRSLLGTDSYIELEKRAKEEGLPVNTYCLWYLRKNIFTEEEIINNNNLKERPISHFSDNVIEGDCLEVMKEIPSKSIDMILCDLPYGTTQNSWDSLIPLDLLWEQYERIIKDQGVIALTAQGLFTAKLALSNPKLFKYKITWVKSKPTNFLNAKKQPLRKHEDICIFYKKQPEYNPQMTYGEPYNKGFRKNQLTGSYGDFKTVEVKSNGERYPTDVVYFKTAESEGEVYHPTQKPVELGRYLVRTFTKEGDVVLDNTCGSGSFLVSAVLEGRRFIGIEKNQEVYLFKKHRVDYIDVCNQRIKEAHEQYKIESSKVKLF